MRQPSTPMMDSAPKQEITAPDTVPFSEKSLGRRFLQNTVALAIGWNVNAVGRFAAAGLVVRSLGATVFGGYALLVTWITIAEWILDFGTTEVFVREANQDPQRWNYLVRIFLALKTIQAPLALLILLTGLEAMQYPQQILKAGIAAGVSLFFTAGIALCRATFKATLTMEREVVAEFVSVIAMLSLIPLVARLGWGLMGLMGTYVVSRAVFLAGCLLLSRNHIVFSVRGVDSHDIRWGMESSLAIGVIGFIVVVYNAADLLVLSRTAGLFDVAVYSAAQRFTMPITMALNAIAVSVYPVLALVKSPERFRKTCKQAVDTTLLLGCFALVCLWCGAEFFMSLLGRELVHGADALRILAVVCVIKAVPMVIGPVLFLVRAQSYALGYMAVALLVKVAVVAAITLRFGYLGAAAGSLGVEVCFLAPITLYFVHAFTGFKIRYSGLWRLVTIVIIVLLVTRRFLPQGNIAGAAVAALLYAILIVGLRVIQPSEVRALLRGDRL